MNMLPIELAKRIRLLSLKVAYEKKVSHIGGSFSITDILSVLYSGILSVDPNDANNSKRDRLFYSKGHACLALYSTLHLSGFFEGLDFLNDFIKDGSYFTSHINHKIPGIEISTGSLGHAFGVSAGVALAAKKQNKNYNIFTILSDGELGEGSNWEAFLFAAHHKLDNLTVIIDFNKIQSFGFVSEVLAIDSLSDKMLAFNFEVYEVDGHNHEDLHKVLFQSKQSRNNKPKVIIANTVKGKGVSFMENNLLWHYKSPDKNEYDQAILELNN